RRELAVRAALGAAPHRLRRQLLVETFVLGALGGIAGLVLAMATVPILARATTVSFPQVDAPRVDLAVLAFAFVAALASSVIFGAVPAWQLARTDLRTALGAESRGGSGRRVGHLIVGAEMAVAFAVLVGAGLLVRSFARVTD